MIAPVYNYDVVIIGGGPSGTAAGALLTKAGKRVLIVEKSAYPKFRIGESLLPNGNALLKKIGVWEKIEAAGFIKKYGAEFETADGALRVHNIFAKGLTPDLEYTYQAERPRFDQIMLEHAKTSGCLSEQNTEISAIESLEDSFELQTKDGRCLTARWLIDASGRARVLGRRFKLPTERNPYPSRIAVFNHFEGVQRQAGKEAGNIIITRREDGWLWQIPVSETSTSIGCVGLSEDLRASGLSPDAWFRKQVDTSPALAKRMSGATAQNCFQTTTDYSHMYTRFAGPRYFLVGDAATFSDPVFSSGIYLGLKSAVAASEALLNADSSGQPLSEKAQITYTKHLKKQTQIIRELIDTFYDDAGFSVFMKPTERFKLFPAVNAIVAGNTNPNLSIRWRYALFRAVCRLNKNYRLVPSVFETRVDA